MRIKGLLQGVILAALFVSFAFALSTCGAGRKAPYVPLAPGGTMAHGDAPPFQAASPSETTLDEALAELEALPTPEGVDASVFSGLKAALREALTAKGVSKIVSKPPTGEANRVDDLELIDNGDGTYTLTWSYRNVGDYNQDGIVNISDLTPLAVHFNEPADETNEWIDGNQDGLINIQDITPLAANFFTTVEGYRLFESRLFEGVLDEHADVGFNSSRTASQAGGARVFSYQLPVSDADHTWVEPIAPGEQLGTPSDIMPVIEGGADSSRTVRISEALEQLDDTAAGQVSISPDGTSMTIPKDAVSADEIQPGKILLSSLDQGFLKKIVSVSDSGGSYIVEVEDAALEEAFDRADIYFFKDLKPEDIEREISSLPGVKRVSADSAFSYTLTDVPLWDDHIVANGSLTVQEPRIEFKLEVNHFLGLPTGVREFRCVLTETVNADVSVEADVDITNFHEEVALIKWALIPWDVNIGFITLAVGPELALNVGIDAGASLRFETGVTASATASVGVSYYNGWGTIQNASHNFGYAPPMLSGNAQVKAYFGPELALDVLGQDLFYAQLYGYGRFDADTNAVPWWTLRAGLETNLGVDIEVLSVTLLEQEWSWNLAEVTLASADPPTPKPVVTDVQPTSGQAGSEVTFTADVSGPQPYTYDWNFGTGATPNTSSDEAPTVTLRSAGTYTVTLIVSNPFGESAPYQFQLQVTPVHNEPPVAHLEADRTSGNAPLTVHFDASGSTDDGFITLYEWDWDSDGSYDVSGSSATRQHTYDEGIYSPTVRVTDNLDATDTAYVRITVNPPGVPDISLNKTSIEKTLPPGGTGSEVFTISNYGNGELEWDGSDDRTWMSIAPTSGTISSGSSRDVTVNFTAPGTPDTYEGTITITSDDPDEPSVEIAVTLTVESAPDAPTNLQASDGTYTDKIRITWNASGGADYYKVYRATSEGGSYGYIGQTSSSRYDDDPGTTNTYWYKAKAHNSFGDSDYSNADSGYKSETGPEWHIITVVSEGSVGLYPSLAIVNGNPAISYYTLPNENVYYTRSLDTYGSSWSSPIEVGPHGRYSSLALVSGNPAVAYYDDYAEDLMYVRAEDSNGLSWDSPLTVDSSNDTGREPSLGVVNGRPAIAYFGKAPDMKLKYVRAQDSIGSAWGTPVIVDDNGWQNRITLTIVAGKPAVAYTRTVGLSDQLCFTQATDENGSSWGTPTIVTESVDAMYEDPWLAVVEGYPAIAYNEDRFDDLFYVRATNANGSSWGAPTLVDEEGRTGDDPSLAIVNGLPAISYQEYTVADSNFLRYVRATNSTGSSWATPDDVDTSGDTGYDTSLLEIDGHPAIAYHDKFNRDLKFAIYY